MTNELRDRYERMYRMADEQYLANKNNNVSNSNIKIEKQYTVVALGRKSIIIANRYARNMYEIKQIRSRVYEK